MYKNLIHDLMLTYSNRWYSCCICISKNALAMASKYKAQLNELTIWKCQKSWIVTSHDWLFYSSTLPRLIGMIYLVTVYWHISLNFSPSLSLSLFLSLLFCRLLVLFNITSEFTLLTCQRHLTFWKWNISYKTKFSFYTLQNYSRS